MSPTSYRTAPPRDTSEEATWGPSKVITRSPHAFLERLLEESQRLRIAGQHRLGKVFRLIQRDVRHRRHVRIHHCLEHRRPIGRKDAIPRGSQFNQSESRATHSKK